MVSQLDKSIFDVINAKILSLELASYPQQKARMFLWNLFLLSCAREWQQSADSRLQIGFILELIE